MRKVNKTLPLIVIIAFIVGGISGYYLNEATHDRFVNCDTPVPSTPADNSIYRCIYSLGGDAFTTSIDDSQRRFK